MQTFNAKIEIERGKRIRSCRRMTALTIREIAQKYNVSPSSFGKWERGEVPITEKIALICTQIFLSENINCDPQWILHDEGELPTLISEKSSQVRHENQEENTNCQVGLFKATEVFKIYNKDAVFCLIKNKSMLPFLKIGDHVAGKPLPPEKFHLAHREICIVQLDNGKILVRLLHVTKTRFVLIANNPEPAQVISPFVLNKPPKIIAPLLFIQRAPSHTPQILDDDTDEWDE